MSSLIRPVPLQSCQTTLRGRRRSSVLALKSVPRLFSAKASTSTDESAVCDEPAPLDISPRSSTPEPSQIPPPIALPSDAHVSDYATSTVVGRYDNSKTIYSLALSPPETVVNSASSSPRSSPGSSTTDVTDDSPEKLEWLKFRLSSAFFVYFLCGWGDGVTGTVLPYFTTAYHLNPMTSSLLFTGSTCGFFIGTFVVERLMNFLGQCSMDHPTNSLLPYVPWISSLFRKEKASRTRYSASQARHLTLIFSSVLHAMFFVMVGREGGYAVTFIAYAVAALARSFITATLNAYFVSGPPQSSLGYAYGLWSIGGVISPIVCQAIIARGVPWPHFYFGSLVLSGINCILLYLAFKPTNRETMGEWHEAVAETTKVLASPTYPTDEKHQHDAPPSSRSHNLRRVLCMHYQWAFSFFALLYSGGETTTSGFTVTYLLGTRNANPKTVGYVTSGYWGGFALARFTWGFFVPRSTFTQRKFIVLGALCTPYSHFLIFHQIKPLLVLALVMHILMWVVDSNIENAISAAFIGFLYGPIFPAILRLTNDILPPEVQMISMGVISAFASVGSALFPFIVGVISRAKGIHTMPYLTVSLGVVLIGLWSLFPTRLPVRTGIV